MLNFDVSKPSRRPSSAGFSSLRYSFVILLAFCIHANAIEWVTTESYVVDADEQVDAETWAYAASSELAGEFARDLFLFSESGDLTGRFTGNVWALGMNMRFEGVCEQKVRLAGRTVQIAGHAKGGAALAGETVKVAESALIGDQLFILGGDVIVDGACAGDVKIIGRRVTLGGTFAGNVEISGDDIVIKNTTVIEGDLSYKSPRELALPRGATLAGELIRLQPEPVERDAFQVFMARVFSQLLWYVAALMVGIPFISLFAPLAAGSTLSLRIAPWRCMLYGFATVFLTPLVALLMLGAIIGIPLALLLLSSYGAILYLARFPIAIFIGTLIFRLRRPNSRYGMLLPLLAGLAIIYALTALPVVGGTLYFIFTVYGAGALVVAATSWKQRVIELKAAAADKESREEENNN